MRGHNICFNVESAKIIPNYHQVLLLIYSSASWSSDSTSYFKYFFIDLHYTLVFDM